jgi:hypothetical protein
MCGSEDGGEREHPPTNRYGFPLSDSNLASANDIINLNANLSFKLFSRSSAYEEKKIEIQLFDADNLLQIAPTRSREKGRRLQVDSASYLSLYKRDGGSVIDREA